MTRKVNNLLTTINAMIILYCMKYQKLSNELSRIERSKSWLARKINISKPLLSLMMQEKRTFQENHKHKICSVLNKQYQDLF